MDYAVALIVYVASLLGVMVGIGSMIVFAKDKWMVRFSTLTTFTFIGTMYLGGMMLQATGN